MKIVALISGGKDSCYSMMQCVAEGHKIVALANLKPEKKDEMDSYMFQTVGHDGVELYAQAMDLPLYRRTIFGSSIVTDKNYVPDIMDEVEDLFQLLHNIKKDIDFEGVSVGAVLSDYQRVRVESVCSRLGLTAVSYLWRRNQQELLLEMIACNVKAIIIKVAALGLEPSKHLGKTLEEIYPHMCDMKLKYGLNVCGEGGEYETFTLDCPLFNKKIVVYETTKVIHSDDAFATVAYLRLKNITLEDKKIDTSLGMFERMKGLPIKQGCKLIEELFPFNDQIPEPTTLPCSQPLVKLRTPQQLDCSDRIVCNHGNGFLSVSGITAVQDDTNEECDIGKLTMNAMDRLKAEITKEGMVMEDIFLVHLYIKDMAMFKDINSMYCQYFTLNPPVRVCVEIDLPGSSILQIDCLAYQPPDDISENVIMTRNTMHVQSLSHWAPANLGPYSQAIQLGNAFFLAGQIGLCPSTMELIEGGIHPQTRLSLRSVCRVLSAMNPRLDLSHVLQCICYVTNQAFIPVAKREWNYALEQIDLMNGYCGDDNDRSGLMTYVVVPTLPKNALVEWHVVAHTNKQTWKYYSDCSRGWNNYTISCQRCFSLEDCLGSLQVTLEVHDESKVIDLRNVMPNIVEDVKKEGLPWKNMQMLRVFYHQDVLHHSDLHDAFVRCFEKVCETLPAFSLVPVKCLSTQSAILMICAWMQG
ncbi:uncharacterized protein LOC100368513 [Saccoglossus kowalevskii]|uniref:Diphthine--ammonia ligase n=1 Tax=Saccoglossus kowalevskii TaxID=10224 RepID=A0ABM0GJV3_SACKO|nr:PREDICTED: diphthine--ammonia ligase-like [Saccoglossus kowalevskii]